MISSPSQSLEPGTMSCLRHAPLRPLALYLVDHGVLYLFSPKSLQIYPPLRPYRPSLSSLQNLPLSQPTVINSFYLPTFTLAPLHLILHTVSRGPLCSTNLICHSSIYTIQLLPITPRTKAKSLGWLTRLS